MVKNEMIAMLLAGGQGSRLGVLDAEGGEAGGGPSAENTGSSIFRSATVLTLALIPWAC